MNAKSKPNDEELQRKLTPLQYQVTQHEATERAFEATTIANAQTVFDVVALPSETPLISAARAAGVNVITGAEVIALQAAEQFERYTGVRPTPAQVAEASAISRA